eukprot:1158537-Pelagomonas_calceolata.AAC.27
MSAEGYFKHTHGGKATSRGSTHISPAQYLAAKSLSLMWAPGTRACKLVISLGFGHAFAHVLASCAFNPVNAFLNLISDS